MSDSPISTALLAYGMSGKVFHAPFLVLHPGFSLDAALERNEPKIQHDYPSVRSYRSLDELLADPTLELAVVNTPNNTHFDLAQQVLLAGKHVLIEKPVATSTAQFEELWALGQQVGRHVFAYHNRRWDSDFQAVRRVVESGQLGQLIEAHFRFDRYKPTLNTKAFKETLIPGSGLLYDLGPHLLDQVISLFGQPLSATKTLGQNREGSQVDDFFNLHLRYANGLNVWLTSSLLVADPGPAYVLHGTRGSYRKQRTDPQEAQLLQGMSPASPTYGHETTGQEGVLTRMNADGTSQVLTDMAPHGDYRQLFEAVYQAIRHGAAYPIREEELRWQNEILDLPV
ncbi:Gfo/Idh/MocA family oxidoreductase [Hymenobacter sp. ASUV-10]|uniref:Gfo/Idh/MocA family oxidoreductase n=1 Tax=Hymenobacter aranciens TaxID=3063996 RepID=A0ABT9B9H1_9BACT|nr:Gfo/Idh/MocA family oxidoreductase [Hymenobacter sp. ASUV-10]MDO7874817.1 Gfo/Idh/MocA family oxidoreductase [Hymenobacter sp. ASUV-10]